jgi:hypothetical protein
LRPPVAKRPHCYHWTAFHSASVATDDPSAQHHTVIFQIRLFEVATCCRRAFTTRQENFLRDDPLDPIAKNATSHNRFGILTSNLMALPCHFANFASLSLFSAIGFENQRRRVFIAWFSDVEPELESMTSGIRKDRVRSNG